jgi:hypothetical protein
MSAYLVSQDHILYLIDAARKFGSRTFSYYFNGHSYEVTTEEQQLKTARMLIEANVASVTHRYPGGGELPGAKLDPGELDSIPFIQGKPEPLQVLEALNCYEYQCCEINPWELSQAWSFVQALRQRVIRYLIDQAEPIEWGAPKLTRDRFGFRWAA